MVTGGTGGDGTARDGLNDDPGLSWITSDQSEFDLIVSARFEQDDNVGTLRTATGKFIVVRGQRSKDIAAAIKRRAFLPMTTSGVVSRRKTLAA